MSSSPSEAGLMWSAVAAAAAGRPRSPLMCGVIDGLEALPSRLPRLTASLPPRMPFSFARLHFLPRWFGTCSDARLTRRRKKTASISIRLL